MNIALWIAQGVLATMFLMAGVMKSTQPKEKLSNMAWTSRSSLQKIRFIGVSEILIGLGLVLPWLTGILPILTIVAAGALILVMILAIAEHVKHKERKDIITNLVFIAIAAFVIWGRYSAELLG